MSFLLGILKIIILLGTLVTVHELGHFLVAKACNVKVHKFSIGFGPKLIKKNKGETEYSLRLIPFGGFVQLEGEDVRSDDERSFSNKPVWQRMLIIVAGATVNLIVAVLLYFITSTSLNVYSLSVIDSLEPTSIAYQEGLRSGDKIISVNGNKTIFSSQVSEAISNSDEPSAVFVIERDKKKIEKTISVPEVEVGMIGAAFTNDGEIAYMQDGEAAMNSGIMKGDKIVSINGVSDLTITEYINVIKENANNELEIVMDRSGEEVIINLIPTAKTTKVFEVNYKVAKNLGFFENSYYAIKETGYYFGETLKGFAKLFTGKSENASIIGPVGIAGEITRTQHIAEFFYLMSAISFSLGICNLLPIPGLDGGKFLFLIIEWIRKKPLEEKTEIALQLAGFALIITLALIVTVKDVMNLF